jgi:hypothetical protein
MAEANFMSKRIFGGLEFEVDDKKVAETEALLQAYVDAMLPADLFREEARTKAFQNATWAVMDIHIEECDREYAERAKHES